MSAQFITLEEAAKKLGVHTDELVEMRPGLYLTCSHLRIGRRLQYASYFAFDFGRQLSD